MNRSVVSNLVALLLAANYFTFQIEPFEEEYEAAHGTRDGKCAFSLPTLTWESFDKENASEAFVCDACITLEFLFLLVSDPTPSFLPHLQYQPIRDKSPPLQLETITDHDASTV